MYVYMCTNSSIVVTRTYTLRAKVYNIMNGKCSLVNYLLLIHRSHIILIVFSPDLYTPDHCDCTFCCGRTAPNCQEVRSSVRTEVLGPTFSKDIGIHTAVNLLSTHRWDLPLQYPVHCYSINAQFIFNSFYNTVY